MKNIHLLISFAILFTSLNSYSFGVTPSAKKKGNRVSCNGGKAIVLEDSTNKGHRKHLLNLIWYSTSEIVYDFYGPHCEKTVLRPIKAGMDGTQLGDRVACDAQGFLGTVSDILTNKAVFVRFDHSPNEQAFRFLDQCENQTRNEYVQKFSVGDLVTCGDGEAYGQVSRHTADNVIEVLNMDESKPWSISFEIKENLCTLSPEQ